MDERTILSNYGVIRFKRRYYYDAYSGEYCHLLDNVFQIPKSQRMTNKSVLKILDLASIMTYKEVGVFGELWADHHGQTHIAIAGAPLRFLSKAKPLYTATRRKGFPSLTCN